MATENVQNATVLSVKIQIKAQRLSGLGKRIACEISAVQTLLWFLELVILNKFQAWQY